MITTILFDLDGTLLPMDQKTFIKSYFGRMTVELAPYGYTPDLLIKGLWKGMDAMVANDGSRRNDRAFFDAFNAVVGRDAYADLPLFEKFYAGTFQQVQGDCGYPPMAAEIVKLCRELGFQVALATNPVFPPIATYSRIRWAGLNPEDFALITTYENSWHSKPNLDYYRDVAAALNVQPEQCVMVGNDVSEDMPAAQLGMQVFLLTDCLICKDGQDIQAYPQGGFPELAAFIKSLKN